MSKAILILTLCLTTTIGSGCFLQPVSRVEKEFSFIDMDAPAMRFAKPVRAELLEKRVIMVDGVKTEEWVSMGVGLVPAGAYIKGRAPGGN